MDKITVQARSLNMSKIPSKNTHPEIIVRKLLYQKGYRYRIHYKITGRPDIVFPGKKIVFFVNGCFWHGHRCDFDHKPKSNNKFWKEKITKNRIRDRKVTNLLKKEGWKVYIIWECDIKKRLDKTMDNIINLIRK